MLIHGFTGSPHEVMPLANHLRHKTDWHIHTPTLPGHAESEDLKDVDWLEWIAYAESQYQRMLEQHDDVYLIGFSMGGLIASYLANRYPVNRLVLLSPALYTPNTGQIIEDITDIFKEGWQKESWQDEETLGHFYRYKEKIKRTPLRAVIQFRKLVKNLSPEVEKLEKPVLIVHGEKDDIVSPKSSEYIYTKAKSDDKHLLWLKESKHVVCTDCEKELIFQQVDHFFQIRTKQNKRMTDHFSTSTIHTETEHFVSSFNKQMPINSSRHT